MYCMCFIPDTPLYSLDNVYVVNYNVMDTPSVSVTSVSTDKTYGITAPFTTVELL